MNASEVADAWLRIERWLAAKAPDTHESLRAARLVLAKRKDPRWPDRFAADLGPVDIPRGAAGAIADREGQEHNRAHGAAGYMVPIWPSRSTSWTARGPPTLGKVANGVGDWRSTVIPPRSGIAWRLGAGQLLRIVDVEGSQSGDLFAVAADDLEDGQSNGRTFDMGGTIRLSTGSLLYSRRSRPLLRIVEDEVGVHDMLYAPCSQEMFEIEHGVTEPHPNCFDNLANSLAAFGVPSATVTIAFNFFMNVVIGPDGRLEIRPPVSRPGQGMTFAAERDVLVAVTSCAAPGANAGGARPIRVDVGGRTS